MSCKIRQYQSCGSRAPRGTRHSRRHAMMRLKRVYALDPKTRTPAWFVAMALNGKPRFYACCPHCFGALKREEWVEEKGKRRVLRCSRCSKGFSRERVVQGRPILRFRARKSAKGKWQNP